MGPRRRALSYPTPPRTPMGPYRNLFQAGLKYAARAAVGAAARRFVSTGTQTAKSGASQTYVTGQRDTVKQYRFKRMPRRKRKRWVKKIKQNAAMDYALAGTTTTVYNGSLTQSIVSGRTQGYLAVHLYGHNGGTISIAGQSWEFGQADLNYLVSNDPKIITTGVKLSKFRFTSAVIDITAKNTSTADTEGVIPDLEVDLYVIKYTSESDQKTLYELSYEAASRVQDVNGGTGTTINLEQRGVTPFDIVTMASMGVKVISKQKFFLPAGNTFTYQYRDPRNHHYGHGHVYDNDGFVLPHQTVTLLCLFKPVVGGSPTVAKLSVGATRTYRYGIIGENRQRCGVLT